MAVSTTPPLPKSQPDIARLNTYSGHTITVTKHAAVRNSVGQMIVPTQPMPLKQILELMTSLPIQYGPGLYKFTCSDTGGTGDDEWMVRLGPEQQEAFSMPGSSSFPGPPGALPPGAPLDPDVKQIMPGFYFNETIGVLYTPWKKAVPWQPGQPWPDPPANATAGGHTPGTTAWSGASWNPANPQTWQSFPAWGSYPATDDSDKKRLEAELAQLRAETQRREEREEQRRRDEESRRERERDREEQRRLEAERERREETRAAEQRKLFEVLVAPKGPSEETLRLQREVEENKRRNEERDREEARRREDQLREEARRAEMKAIQDRTDALIREMKDRDRDRPDPLMTMMTTLFQAQQQTSLETARLNRESADRTAATTERHTQQLMETMRTDRTGAAESTRVLMEQTRGMLEMQREVVQYVVDNTGNSAPWYATAIQNLTDKAGPAIQALAQARAQQGQPPVTPQYMPPTVRQPPATRPVAPATTRPIPNVASPASIAANNTGDRPEGVRLDGDQFIVPGGPGHPGHAVPVVYVQEHGWRKTLEVLSRQAAPSPIPPPPQAPAAPAASTMNGAAPQANGVPSSGASTTVYPPLSVVPPPTVAETPPAKARGGRKKKTAAAPPPPPSAPQGYSVEEFQAMTTEQAIALVKPFSDEDLFGTELWPYVQQLRVANPPLPPEQVVEYIAQALAANVAAGALDLIRGAQFAAVVERLFPDADDAYQNAIVDALAARLGAEVVEDEEGAQA